MNLLSSLRQRHRRTARLTALAALAVLAPMAPGQVQAQIWFLKIDGLNGSMTEGRYAGWTPVRGVRPVMNQTTNANGGAVPTWSCEIKKAIDGLSPDLLTKCGVGDSIRRVSLACADSAEGAPRYRMTLLGARVISFIQGAGRGGVEGTWDEAFRLESDQIELTAFTVGESSGASAGLAGRYDGLTGRGDVRVRPPFRAVVTGQEGRGGVVVSWIAEGNHRYNILASSAMGEAWKRIAAVEASEDGPLTRFVPFDGPAMFLRVEETE